MINNKKYNTILLKMADKYPLEYEIYGEKLLNKYDPKDNGNGFDREIYNSLRVKEEEYLKKEFRETLVVVKGAYVCKKKDKKTGKVCGNDECSIIVLQTRSQDEGQTTTITCNRCGNVWTLGG